LPIQSFHAQLPVRSGCAPSRGTVAVVLAGGSCFANTILGAGAVTLIAFCTLAGTGATTYTLPVSVWEVVRSRTTAPFFFSINRPA